MESAKDTHSIFEKGHVNAYDYSLYEPTVISPGFSEGIDVALRPFNTLPSGNWYLLVNGENCPRSNQIVYWAAFVTNFLGIIDWEYDQVFMYDHFEYDEM